LYLPTQLPQHSRPQPHRHPQPHSPQTQPHSQQVLVHQYKIIDNSQYTTVCDTVIQPCSHSFTISDGLLSSNYSTLSFAYDCTLLARLRNHQCVTVLL